MSHHPHATVGLAYCRVCLFDLFSVFILTPSLAWIFVVLGDSYDLDTRSWNPDGLRIIKQQDFWLAFGMTVLYVRLFRIIIG